ncbi:TsaE protein, required for threonylcarbamoyladenosine t(6)A37 formation in tRNA [Desulfurella amilsii]|uniref:tRNA threonylcarbamoyladenosine biosynthesis protein TsaE n=1 Tax=Desulfurella amilsii TaxID=1562698 RepID=A0A1X4XWK4_9BACT|nr:tRNA (adenosine(37)-N6)-threonylcarbamoyltransferase complex ATPase subunit type 1 TsaE [Desulfurella amilsii]OSS41898.1 TsaE protein, required for threonylcarbamoyladenosine t(6)A37 formation in tRNA [Desulfurella amilsii]
MIYWVKTLSQTKKIAKEFAQNIKNAKRLIIFLQGDLGTGKTTFVRFVLYYLGIKDFRGSPSFSIANEYLLNDKKIIHMDLYRVETKESLLNMGICEYFEENAIFFVEWPNLLEIKPDIMIKFILTNTQRSMEIDWGSN